MAVVVVQLIIVVLEIPQAHLPHKEIMEVVVLVLLIMEVEVVVVLVQ